MNTPLPDTIVEEVTTRTEGWLVGLQLLGLSLQRHANLASLLDEVSGNQRYTLDYLTQEVLRQQPQDVQTFLLSRALAFTSHACFARRLRRLEGGVLSGDTPYPSKGLRPLHSCLSGFSGKRKGPDSLKGNLAL